MATPALPQTECGAQPAATPALPQSESGSGAQPAPTNTNASATPLIQTRAPRQPCPVWKIYKSENNDDRGNVHEESAQKKKQKAQTKAQSRKRKREAAEANIEHVPGTPGQKHTFYGAPVKYAFLKNLWETSQPIRPGSYRVVRGSTHPSHPLANVQTLKIVSKFVHKFGRNLALKQDPDPGINYEPYSVNDYPEDTRLEEQERRAAFDKDFSSVMS